MLNDEFGSYLAAVFPERDRFPIRAFAPQIKALGICGGW
jgi:hypothetical protein